jgi:hypothetical protein
MPRIRFTQNLQRHVECLETVVEGTSVREALEAYFEQNERARGYIVDDQGGLRQHMMLFVDGEPIADRKRLSDALSESSELYVVQALSGG